MVGVCDISPEEEKTTDRKCDEEGFDEGGEVDENVDI